MGKVDELRIRNQKPRWTVTNRLPGVGSWFLFSIINPSNTENRK